MNCTQIVIDAFLEGKPKKRSNTESTGQELLLFDNCIAKYVSGIIWITTCGYNTRTTRNRLSRLGANIRNVRGKLYFNGSYWDGNLIKLNDSAVEIKEKQSIFD